MPFTPGLLSTTMVWPSASDILVAKARPIWSVALPAAKGTMALMGLVGQAWARAAKCWPQHSQGGGEAMERSPRRI
jgi:hypothetical protein